MKTYPKEWADFRRIVVGDNPPYNGTYLWHNLPTKDFYIFDAWGFTHYVVYYCDETAIVYSPYNNGCAGEIITEDLSEFIYRNRDTFIDCYIQPNDECLNSYPLILEINQERIFVQDKKWYSFNNIMNRIGRFFEPKSPRLFKNH